MSPRFDPPARESALPDRDPKSPAGDADDDDDIALPPFDDEDEEDEESQLDVGDLLRSLEDEDADPFDDSTAADLETGLDIGLHDEGEQVGDDAEGGIDVGGLEDDLVVQDEIGGGLDDRLESGLEEDEDLESYDRERSGDDGGEEGTVSSGEDEVSEADLPELDADEEGDHEAEDVVAEMTFAADTSLPPWDAQRFAVVEGAGAAVPCSALAIGSGKVAAAGEVVLLVEEEAAIRCRFEAGARAVAIADDGSLMAASRGELWISRDGGKTVSPLGKFRGSAGAVSLAGAAGRVWILSDGVLSWIATAGGSATPVRGADVVRIAGAGPALIALSRGSKGPVLERLGMDDGGTEELRLDAAAAALALDERVVLAAAGGGKLLALASPEAVSVSRDGGQSYRLFALPGVAALSFAGDQDAAPLLALLVPPLEDEAFVALLPAEGSPSLVAELAGGGLLDDGSEEGAASIGASAMGWDASREFLWIACRAGLLAFARARKH